MKTRILVLVTLLAGCAPATAQTPAPAPPPPSVPAPAPVPLPPSGRPMAPLARPLTISGAGSVTCRTWTSELQTGPDHLAHQQWLVGFISGYNAFIQDGANVPPDSSGIIGWADNEACRGSPDMTLAQMGIALVEFTRQQSHFNRLWPPTPPVQYVP